MRRPAAGAPGAPGGDSDDGVLRRYYAERDFLTSADGIMKLLSVVLCVAAAVLLLRAACWPLRAPGAALELAAAAALAALCAARLLQLAACAPRACFYGDLIVSTATGLPLLVTALLGLVLCDSLRAADYAHGVLGLAAAASVTGSAVVAYVSVTRRWDAARAPAPPSRAAIEQDA